jgi:L-amino acid N-acyltransferase YncA
MIDHEIQIRAADQPDVESIANIWLSCLHFNGINRSAPTEGDSIAAFEKRIRFPEGRSRIWVAVENRTVVGWQSLSDFGITQITKAGMSSTYVSPQCHSKGVGKKLLAHATAEAGAAGYDYLVAFIKTDNIRCIKIVLSLGWKLVGPLPRNEVDGTELAYYACAVPKSTNPRL